MSKFGTSSFYSSSMNKLGYKSIDLIVNDEILQNKWAHEHKLKIHKSKILSRIMNLPYFNRVFGSPVWVQKIALAQIQEIKPDIVYIHNLSILNPSTLKKIKKLCRLLVGQIACPLPPIKNIKPFDLIITSFPHFVSLFKKMGIDSEYQKLAFEPEMLKITDKCSKKYDVTFIGSFTPYHQEGIKILEEVAKNIPIHVWGQGLEFLSPFSPIRKNYHGEAWGIEMYKIFRQSKIVLNRHISTSKDYANNMRLYEATGMGALVITDHKRNLNNLFKVGKEIVEYKSSKNLINRIKYYLKHDEERKKISKAGQKRTLKEHNYYVRSKRLIKILNKYL
ncbi:MAG: glycosyltransferase [Actinomycetota bacterium]